LDLEELLLRQVYPAWLEEDGEPSSQAFYPWRDVDDGCLSVDQRSLNAEDVAFSLFTAPRPVGFGQPSAGVWGLLVEEVTTAGVTAWADPVMATESTPPNLAHALVEFAEKPRSKWKSIGRMLKLRARARGRLHPKAA
jgi:hypothetical protein